MLIFFGMPFIVLTIGIVLITTRIGKLAGIILCVITAPMLAIMFMNVEVYGFLFWQFAGVAGVALTIIGAIILYEKRIGRKFSRPSEWPVGFKIIGIALLIYFYYYLIFSIFTYLILYPLMISGFNLYSWPGYIWISYILTGVFGIALFAVIVVIMKHSKKRQENKVLKALSEAGREIKEKRQLFSLPIIFVIAEITGIMLLMSALSDFLVMHDLRSRFPNDNTYGAEDILPPAIIGAILVALSTIGIVPYCRKKEANLQTTEMHKLSYPVALICIILGLFNFASSIVSEFIFNPY